LYVAGRSFPYACNEHIYLPLMHASCTDYVGPKLVDRFEQSIKELLIVCVNLMVGALR